MNHDKVLTELKALIERLNSIIDIMIQSTRQFIDTGNVNYELKNIIDKLDEIIESIEDSKEIELLESAKYDITYATLDVIDNADIFDKINKLGNAKRTLIEMQTKLNEHL